MTIWLGALVSKSTRLARNVCFDAMALVLGSLLLRLMLGYAPGSADRAVFRRALRTPYVKFPPLLRALTAVPDVRWMMRNAVLLVWHYQQERKNGVDLFPAHITDNSVDLVPDLMGQVFTAWTGPKIALLHLEKCGGIAFMRWLVEFFHPFQIDPDPNRSQPPHLFERHPGGLGRDAARFPLVWGHYDLPSLRRLDPGRLVFTVLREPRARIISLYHYWRSVTPNLLDPAEGNFTVALAHRLNLLDFLRHDDPFLRDYLDNFYVRRLTGFYATGAVTDRLAEAPEAALALARQALARLGFVGITERMDESMARFSALIGAPAPARAVHANTAETNPADPSGWFRGVSRTALTPEIEAELDRLTGLDQVLYAEALAHFNGVPVSGEAMAPA
jgi:hypothetical protein